MAKEFSSTFKHQPPLSFSIVCKKPRSYSIIDESERQSILQAFKNRERKLSATTNIGFISTKERKNKVAELVEHYEGFTSTDNVQSNSNRNKIVSSFDRYKTARTSSDTIRASLPQKNKINTKSSSHLNLPSAECKVETTIHHIPQSVSKDNDSDESKDSHTEISKTISSDAITNNNETNLYKHFKEVYTTEVTYVKKLYALAFKIPSQIKETCEKNENLIKKFNNIYEPLCDIIKRLYKFHHEVILPHTEQYEKGHRKDNIWSIFQEQEYFKTIEELYEAYYIAYDKNHRDLELLCRSHSLMHEAMLQCQDYLEHLYPIGELNCANQRLTRYILLMKSCMKLLKEDSTAYKDTHFIHNELERIAIQCEEKLLISPTQLNKLKTRIDNKSDCFENQRLIWHGSLKKQSPRKHNVIVQLYIIVFSKCILVCEESGNKLELKRQLSIQDIKIDVIESQRLEPSTFHPINGQQPRSIICYPFRVNAVEKSYKFLVDKESDREKWVNKIRQATEEYKNQNSTVEIRQSRHHSTEQQFGIRSPPWVEDIDVTRCQICNNRFKSAMIGSRRHHCRACGCCICNTCSTEKLVLPYCSETGAVRVCDACYTHATGILKYRLSFSKILRNPENTILFGDFRCISTNSIVWIDLQDDYQLHIYGAKLDRVEDFSINLVEQRQITFNDQTRTFILNGKDKIHRFSIELNHHITYEKNDYIDENLKTTNNKLLFYANLWYNAIQLARSKTVPSWYIGKRVSIDSGIST